MPSLIERPTAIPCVGTKPKLIEEFIGHVNTKDSRLSIARMTSPPGWTEPAQTPDFDEFTLVLKSDQGEWRKITLEVTTALADIETIR